MIVDLIYYALIAGGIGLLFAVFLVTRLMKKDRGNQEVREISELIERAPWHSLSANTRHSPHS